MSAVENITIVAEPSRFSGPVPAHPATSSRELYAYDDFAKALASRSGSRVEVVEERLCAAPPGGLILLDATSDLDRVLGECPPAMAAALPRRILLLNADRSAVLDLLERYRLVGAVTQQRYFDWLHHRDRESGGGLYGLKSVGLQLGAVCSPAFHSQDYCLLGGTPAADLPSLVVAYLEHYSNTLPAQHA
jgi:hypothetical protein